MSRMKCLFSLEIWGMLAGTTAWPASATLIPGRPSLPEHPKVTPHSGLRDLLPVKRLIQVLPPFLSNEVARPIEVPQRVLSSESSTPQSILIEDLVLFLISWSLVIFSFISYMWHLPAPSEIERVGTDEQRAVILESRGPWDRVLYRTPFPFTAILPSWGFGTFSLPF